MKSAINTAVWALVLWTALWGWWELGSEASGNVFLFFAWLFSVLSVVTVFIDPKDFGPRAPKWVRSLKTVSWGGLLVLMVADGRFVLGSAMLLALVCSLVVRKRLDDYLAARRAEGIE